MLALILYRSTEAQNDWASFGHPQHTGWAEPSTWTASHPYGHADMSTQSTVQAAFTHAAQASSGALESVCLHEGFFATAHATGIGGYDTLSVHLTDPPVEDWRSLAAVASMSLGDDPVASAQAATIFRQHRPMSWTRMMTGHGPEVADMAAFMASRGFAFDLPLPQATSGDHDNAVSGLLRCKGGQGCYSYSCRCCWHYPSETKRWCSPSSANGRYGLWRVGRPARC
jgi:hypothetical protein